MNLVVFHGGYVSPIVSTKERRILHPLLDKPSQYLTTYEVTKLQNITYSFQLRIVLSMDIVHNYMK